MSGRLRRVIVPIFVLAASISLVAPPAAAVPPPWTVAASLSTPTASPAAASVLARKGDTLWRLAATHCGRGELYQRLADASGIANPNWIIAGRTRVVLDCGGSSRPAVASRNAPRPPLSTKVQTVLAYALAQVGKPYRWAAAGPYAYDCSGLVMASYARVGVRLPHQSGAMLSYGIRVTRSQLRPGDVIWPYPGHVVMYLGGGRIIESPRPGYRVHTTTLYAFWTARRMA